MKKGPQPSSRLINVKRATTVFKGSPVYLLLKLVPRYFYPCPKEERSLTQKGRACKMAHPQPLPNLHLGLIRQEKHKWVIPGLLLEKPLLYTLAQFKKTDPNVSRLRRVYRSSKQVVLNWEKSVPEHLACLETFLFLQPESGRCYWHQMSKGQEYHKISHSAQDSPWQESIVAPNIKCRGWETLL